METIRYREIHHNTSASTTITVLQRILAGNGMESGDCFINARAIDLRPAALACQPKLAAANLERRLARPAGLEPATPSFEG